MTEQKMAINNIIVETLVGSQLYGTNTLNSDIDKFGVFIADKEYYLGLKNIEEVDLSLVSKDISGKNNKDAIDFKVFELRKFIKLAFDNNPSVLEILFANKHLKVSDIWNKIIENREYFLDSEMIRKKFLGYSCSQKKKMIVKLENYDILKEAYDILEKVDNKFLIEVEEFYKFDFKKKDRLEFKVADIIIPRNLTVKRAKELLANRLGRVGHRQELILKHGYDCKFAHHVIRLLLEGEELLTTKNLVLPLKDKYLLLDIKNGKYKVKDIYDMATEIEDRIRLIDNDFKRNFDKVNELMVDVISSYLKV